MITHTRGDLFSCPVDALVNPVNCVGVMGRGLAAVFRRRYPESFADYAQACRTGQMRVGRVRVFERTLAARPRYLIAFPTKRHWRAPSRLEDIEAGLDDLAQVLISQAIDRVALPALGCGLGGLAWQDVRAAIEQRFATTQSTHVFLFAPR